MEYFGTSTNWTAVTTAGNMEIHYTDYTVQEDPPLQERMTPKYSITTVCKHYPMLYNTL